jgi:AcrR family transcriptional regulator
MLKDSIRTHSNNPKLVAERRGSIVQSALRLFLRKGYQGTTMRELAEACGMAYGALYHYISSKADILHLICTQPASENKELERIRKQLIDAPIEEALKRCIRSYFRWVDEQTDLLTFFQQELCNFTKEDSKIVLASQEKIVDFFTNLLSDGVRKGEFIIEDARMVAINITMIGQNWATRPILNQYLTLDQYTERQINLILKQIEFSPRNTSSNLGINKMR